MLPGGRYKAPAPIYPGRALPHRPGRPQRTARPPQRRRCVVAVDQLIVTAAWLALRPWLRGQHLHVRVAHPEPQRQPAGTLGYGVELPDHERAAAVGLHDLDLETVSRANAIDRDGRHQPTLRPRHTTFYRYRQIRTALSPAVIGHCDEVTSRVLTVTSQPWKRRNLT